MKKGLFVSIGLALIVVALILPLHTSPVVRAQATGGYAEAEFSNTDGCIRTDVEVFAAQPTSYAPSKATISVFQHDQCTPKDPLMDLVGTTTLPEQAFQIGAAGDVATLHIIMDGFDYVANKPVTVNIAQTWTATGSGRGRERPAVASGRVFAKERNFTPNPSKFGEIVRP